MVVTFDAGVRAGDRAAAGIGALALANVAFLAGCYRDARRWAAEAEIHFEHRDVIGNLLVTQALHVRIAAATGDGAAAAAALQRCRETLGGRKPLPAL